MAQVHRQGLTLLSHNVSNASGDRRDLNVIFVHGLRGHPRDTWSHTRPKPKPDLSEQSGANSKRSKGIRAVFGLGKDKTKDGKDSTTASASAVPSDIFWPEEYLVQDLPQARVWTYGYNADVIGGLFQANNQNSVSQHGRDLAVVLERDIDNKDPIVFVVHSLGGIITKDALHRSEAIGGRTRLIVFLGTPHRGSSYAGWGEIASNLAKLGLQDSNKRLVQTLEVSSEVLDNIHEEFKIILSRHKLKVHSFQEAKGISGMKGLDNKVVDNFSSKLDLSREQETVETIDGNHMQMARCSSREDMRYRQISGVLKQFMKGLQDVQIEKPWTLDERACQQSLCTFEYERHKERNTDRVAGTCTWFLKHDHFEQWQKTDEASLLWVSADPGCGKSVLSKFLVDEHLRSTQSRTTCYFFFKDDDIEQKSATRALGALLHQLFSKRKALIRHAMPDYEDIKDRLSQSFDRLWRILVAAAGDPNAGEVICILDALDECEEESRNQLIKAINRFFGKVRTSGNMKSRLKIVATSRPYLNIERKFSELARSMPHIHLEGEKETETISQEISRVIHYEIFEKIGNELKLIESEKEELERVLLSMPHRTYLWFYLVLDQLRTRDKITSKSFQQILKELPGTVEAAYEAILDKSTDKLTARKLLCIVIAAVRPLTLEEMHIALSVDDQRCYQDLDLETTERFRSRVRDLCGLFINIVDGKVFLIHQTAKEFLLVHAEKPSWTWRYSVEQGLAELDLARTCITYLTFTDLDEAVGGSGEKEMPERYRLLGYSAAYWAMHIRKVEKIVETGLDDTLTTSCLELYKTQSHRYRNWFSVYWKEIHPYKRPPQFTTSLTVASFFGHATAMNLLLNTDKVDVEAKDSSHGRTPLSWAAEGGHAAVVKLLLDKGANVNAQGGFYGNALQAASRRGHEQVVKLLLDEGAEVNARGGFYGNALQAASEGGHEQLVKLLLDAGAEVNAQGGYYGNALEAASEGGHEQVVKLLLDKGANVNAQGGFYGNALQAASRRGHEQVVKLLLDEGAEVNARGGEYGNALQAASEGGHEQVVKLLLGKGADVNAQGGYYGNALQAASEGGHEQVVKLLFDKGANVNAQGGHYGNALQAASRGGHEQVVKLLFDAGAEVNAQGGMDGNALQAASSEGHEQVVKLLLDKGADVNAQGGRYGNALQAASEGGHEQVVKLLLDKGANVNAQGGYYGNALQAASEGGHEQVVKLLFDKGADVNAQGGYYGNALYAASSGGHEQVVKLLLDEGA